MPLTTNFRFTFPEDTTYHVATFEGDWYQIDKKPFSHSSYLEKFRFTAQHPQGDAGEDAYFVYPTVEPGQAFFSRELSSSVRKVFPLDYIMSTTKNGSEESKVYLIDGDEDQRQVISADNKTGADCYKGKGVFTFNSHNVERTGENVYE